MSLSPEKSEWLDRFSGGMMSPPLAKGSDQKAINAAFKIKRDQEEIAERTLKDVLLDSAFQALANEKDDIRDAFNFEVEVGGRIVRTLAPQKEAFDTEQTREVTKSVKADTQKKAKAALDLLLRQKDRLASVTVKRSVPIVKPDTNGALSFETKEEPLFTDDEIGSKFYEPLEREMVLPDNFVTARYSPTQKMIDETNALYIKECQEKGGRRDTGAVRLSKAALAMASSLTNAVVGDPSNPATLNSTSDLGVDKQAQMASRIITEGLQALIGMGVDVVDTAVDAAVEQSFKQSQWQALANSLAMGVAKAVAGTWGAKDPELPLNIEVFELLGDAIAGAVASVSAVTSIARWAKSEPPRPDFPVSELIAQVGTAVATAISAAGDNVSQFVGGDLTYQTEQSVDFNAISGVAQVVINITANFTSPEAVERFRNGEITAAILSLMTTASTSIASAVAGALGNLGEDQAATDLKDQYQPLQSMQKEQAEVDKVREQIETFSGKMVAEVERKLHIKLEEKLDQAQEADAKTVDQELADEKKKYAEALEKLTRELARDETDFKTINHLIANIERDKAIASFAFTVAGSGVGISAAAAVASTIAPPLKAAGDAVKFVQNIYACVGRIQALIAWMDSYGDAVRSSNRYTSAVENFINSNRDLLCNNTVQALLNLAKLVADATSVAMPAMASAATVFDAAATTADLCFQCYRQAELDRAWKLTLKSIENPANRQLALVVRELNPTLAKYAIAYGALIEKDPVAVRAMDRIGLDRETLMNPNNKVGDVRKYLKSLYSDDLKLVAEMDKARAKAKVPDPELTVKAWSLSCMMWSKSASPDGGKSWVLATPAEILPNLERVATYRGLKNPVAKVKALPQLIKALEALDAAFSDFDPEDPSGEPMSEVKKTAEAYARLARATMQAEQLNAQAANSQAQIAQATARPQGTPGSGAAPQGATPQSAPSQTATPPGGQGKPGTGTQSAQKSQTA